MIAPSGGTMQTLPAVADTFSHSGRPATTFGDKRYMRAHGPGDSKVSYVRFDVSPLIGLVSSAVVEVHLTKLLDAGMLEIHPVLADWDEAALSANNKPPYGAPAVSSVPITAADVGTGVALDITSLVQDWLDSPADVFGIALVSPDGHGRFHTREAAHPPLLVVQST